MKMKMTKVFGLAALLLCGSAFAAEGDIWEISPCTREGVALTAPVSSVDAALPAGSNLYFKVRLVSRNGGSKWHVYNKLMPGELDYLNPLRIGVYVSGKLVYADYLGELEVGDHFTDVIFRYIVKPGDFALPIKLATANGPAGDVYAEDLSYYFDPLTSSRWECRSSKGSETFTCNWWFYQGDPVDRGETSLPDVADFSLKEAGFYLKTINFDSEWEKAGVLWRSVHEGSTATVGPTPSLASPSGPEEIVTLYVWSTNEAVVKVVSDKTVTMRVGGTSGAPVEKTFSVAAVKFERGQLASEFEILGVESNKTTHLVLSAYDHFNYSKATSMREVDYVTVPVTCVEALPPSVVVKPAKATVTADGDYTEYVTELSVSFTQAFTNDVTFTVVPKFENADAEAAGINWKDYIRVSDAKELTSITSATNFTFTIPAGKTVPYENGSERKVYLFALRSDKWVINANHLQFEAQTDNADAKLAIKGWNTRQGDININADAPTILLPEEGDTSLTAVAGADRTLRIQLSDTYADSASDLGYEIWIIRNSDTEQQYQRVGGENARYKVGQGGYLYLTNTTDVLPSVKYSVTDPAANKSILYVKSPVSGLQSEERNFIVTVSAPAGFKISSGGKETVDVKEGDSLQVDVVLDKQNTTGGSLYAFLAPLSTKDTNGVECAQIAGPGGVGVEIPAYGTDASFALKMIDGCSSVASSQFRYKVILRTASSWEDGEDISSYLCKNTLTINSANVIPSVKYVQMNGSRSQQVSQSGETVKVKFPADDTIYQTFIVKVDEPGTFDKTTTALKDRFQVRWTVEDGDGFPLDPPEGCDASGITYGNPDEIVISNRFTYASKYKVIVELKDKDMDDFGNGKLDEVFEFYVDVIDNPAISIEPFYPSLGDRYLETDTTAETPAYFNLNLAVNNCDFPLTVKLTIGSGDMGSDNPGSLVLKEVKSSSSSQSSVVYDGKDAQNRDVYYVTFPKKAVTVPVTIRALDGTLTSSSDGFVLIPEMQNTGDKKVPVVGKYPADYYVGVESTIKIKNVEPEMEYVSPEPSTNIINTAIGTVSEPITWNFNDITNDFAKGIEVIIRGGTTEYRQTFTNRTEAIKAGNTGFSPNFNSSGDHIVTLIVKDSDGGTAKYNNQSMTWHYFVTPSKNLMMIPNGPTSGRGTSLSTKYANASGKGQGRVWAAEDTGASFFEHTVNCGKSKTWTVYGYGYKVGDVEGTSFHYPDGTTGYYDERDIKIDAKGNSGASAYSAFAYADENRDSFLYAWVQISRSTDEQSGVSTLVGNLLNGGINPEKAYAADAGSVIGLPAEADEDGAYDDSTVEAVFSKELYSADNMGDINQDGVPDVYFSKYKFVETEATGEGETETTEIDDLQSLTKFNEDNDFLPALLSKSFSGLSSNSPIFSAKMEIRGYGEHFNDATAERFPDGAVNLCRVDGVKPLLRYTDPKIDKTSTLDEVERLAWEDFAASQGYNPDDETKWSTWSPERPTNPTDNDTDGDGFDDGFEYWFWYRAHVGYIDEVTGKHRYMTGRRYNPRNPATGDLITREQIEKLFDPITPYSGEAMTRDTDNDGLPDLFEFLLGTNPVDFDTDGDGLPDGWEVVIAGTDPLKAKATGDSVSDTMRNYDGDAMAFSQVYMESDGTVLPVNQNPPSFTTFALIDANGSDNGIQWYAIRQSVNPDDEMAINTVTANAQFLSIAGESYLVLADGLKTVTSGSSLRLATDYSFDVAYTAEKDAAVGTNTCAYLRLKPVHLAAGTVIDAAPESVTEYQYASLVTGYDEKTAQTAWVYGNAGVDTATKANTLATTGGFGMLTLGAYQAAPADQAIAVLPKVDDQVALIHYLVYQEYGFDPRTAWNATTPLNKRWGSTNADGTVKENNYSGSYGYAGVATRTREFTAYDEFLLSSFFYNTSMIATDDSDTVSASTKMLNFWKSYTTNPHGPAETEVIVSDYYDCSWDTNGADTDKDGVPDGWELYVMGGVKEKGLFNFVSAYQDRPYSNFSPFEASAAKADKTDNSATSGDRAAPGDGDGLTELEEFAGTDTTLYYADYSDTILRPEQHAKWLNKFFPTDPWASDTDGDGMTDANEIKNVSSIVDGYIAYAFSAANFIYGEPTDNGSACIPGGGLNPCSVDTDRDGLPDPWEAQYAGTFDSENGIQDKHHGIMNGMDGTVADAYTRPWVKIRTSYKDGDDCEDCINRDYDRDGLENWQEYLTGAMRCWRYDDPQTRWDATPTENYFEWDADNLMWKFSIDKALAATGCATEDEFWGKTLVDVSSPIYNPYLVMDQSPAGSQYFTRVKNGFDPVFSDTGAYYFFYDGVDHVLSTESYKNAWLAKNVKNLMNLDALANICPCPQCYMGTSPIDADSDHDGMDDYYELFHGMNPLLGAPGVAYGNGKACDLVYTSWCLEDQKSPVKAWRTDEAESLEDVNYWVSSRSPLAGKAYGTQMDFRVYPWLNGLAAADPDGDDLRNREEAIQNVDKGVYGHHSDPTPLWMTDSTYSNSLVRLFFRVPSRFAKVELTAETFEYDGKTYNFHDFGGYVPAEKGLIPIPAYFAAFNPDAWGVAAQYHYNWAYSFEENEGYDTDHDGVFDNAELTGKANGVTDPVNFDSPMRRQAMYFPAGKNALQTLPQQEEIHPLGGRKYNEEPTLRQYTVECWVYPESSADSVVIERPVWVDESKAADKQLVRKNFQLAIRNGRWYTKFDTTGTGNASMSDVDSGVSVERSVWTHLAATYDGSSLKLYINGVERSANKADVKNGLWPATASDAVRLSNTNSTSLAYNAFNFDKDYAYSCILIGAELKNYSDFALDFEKQWIGRAIDLTQCRGWNAYKNFFQGYVDEVRIWDGARTVTEINDTMKKRFTAEDIAKNRSTVYEDWKSYGSRYSAESGKVAAELRFHFTFDATFAAQNVNVLAKAPQGFLNSETAVQSRPADWYCSWWKQIVDTYGSAYGTAEWVTWISDTVSHMTRFDDSVGDSFYWSKDFEGGGPGEGKFVHTAEPVSRWTQMVRQSAYSDAFYRTTAARHQLVYSDALYGEHGERADYWRNFDFAGRGLCQFGADLLPLGGAFVKYCDNTVGMWDGQGASSNWELTGTDSDNDGLPDWWETYAAANYTQLTPARLTWESNVTYTPNGMTMTAGQAYLRDLARGMYADSNEMAATGASYRQVYDLDNNSIPDWWEKLYGISGCSATGDEDNDGLPNYVEYLLSEVFNFKGIAFNPTKPKSVDANTLDYFYPVGSLYVGEIFTDHDLVDDAWEDLYSASYSSRVKYDAFADADKDGWCNRSEARYSNMCMPIVADKQSHYVVAASATSTDQLMADYPIPTLDLTLSYKGAQAEKVRNASVVVKVTSDPTLFENVDATFNVSAATLDNASTGKSSASSGSNKSVSKTRYLGKWSNRHVVGTLTPGNISVNSLTLQYCYDPSSVMYTWMVLTTYVSGNDIGYGDYWKVSRGTRAEYDEARRKYGDNNVELISATTAYVDLNDLTLRTDEQTGIATWTDARTGKEFGTVNTMTGAFDLNLGIFAGQYLTSSTNTVSVSNDVERAAAEDQTYRISYSANPSAGLPRHLYLGEADTGYVREGKNVVFAWADLDGGTAGKWDAGEPFGIVRDVDVSWRGTKIDLELSDTHPVFDRLNIETAASSRTVINGTESGTSANPSVATNGTIIYKTTSNLSGGIVNHIRVVPYLIRGTVQEDASDPDLRCNAYAFASVTNRVVAEFDLNGNNGNTIHEGYFLRDGEYDIDWNGFIDELRLNPKVISTVGDITAVSYRLVLGDSGAIGPAAISDNMTIVNALETVIERRYEREDARTQPTNVAPGSANGEIVYDASPTFTWRLDEPKTGAGKFGCSYSAFNIVMKNASGVTVWESGLQRTPAVNDDGSFSWKAPIYVGDMLPSGAVFANKADYTWSVSMYNAKFREDLYSNETRFRMQVQVNGYVVGTARAAVRYFGPAASYAGKTIRVRAYESPDFTGRAIAGGYVQDPSTVSTTGQAPTANAMLVGIPAGTYYFQAWIDSNDNGVCDPWETSGYFCNRDGSTEQYLNPVGVKFAEEVGEGDLVEIYLEDADTDGDGLPDAWEYALYGSLDAKGVEAVSETAAGEFVVNQDLSGELALQQGASTPAAGLAGRALSALSSAGTLALALGVDPSKYESFNAAISGSVSEELAQDGVSISSIDFSDGKIVIKVEAETETKVESTSPLASSVETKTGVLTVKCSVAYAETADGLQSADWNDAGTITVGGEAQEVDATAIIPSGLGSCFIKVKLEKCE